MKANRQRLRNPAKTAAELVATYEQQGLPQTCAALREALALI